MRKETPRRRIDCNKKEEIGDRKDHTEVGSFRRSETKKLRKKL